MARYEIFGTSQSLFQSNTPGPLAARLLYVSATEFGIQNDDGSRTYVKGSGFAFDADQGFFTDGLVTQIVHYDSAGRPVDNLKASSGASLIDAATLQSLLENASGAPLDFGTDLDKGLLGGDDVIEARVRANYAVVSDTLHGQAGDDTIYSGSGNDFVSGGAGNDRLYGGTGNDKLIGGDFFFNNEPAFLTGPSNDMLHGGAGDDLLLGGQGNDAIHGGDGLDTAVYAGTFSSLKIVQTASGFTVASPLDGRDTLTGIERIAADDGTWQFSNGAWAKLNGTPGVALLRPQSVQWGTSAADTIADLADARKNIVYGLGGDDTINLAYTGGEKIAFGGTGNDRITADFGGNFGAARLYGEAGDDTLSGTINGDFLSGGSGDDTIDGGFSGSDFILGGAGRDTITGGLGNDVLTGGADADVFNFAVVNTGAVPVDEQGWGHDVITDFVVGVDHLDIAPGVNAPTLTDTAAGLLVTVELVLGFPAPDTTATILLTGVHGAGITLGDLLI